MSVNRKIVVTTLVIAAIGVVNSLVQKKAITPVVMGAYILCLLLAIADVFGGAMSQIAGGIAMVALVFVVLHEIPWGTITSFGKKQK